MWRPEAERWLCAATEDECHMCTRIQIPVSLQCSFGTIPVPWRVVVGTWQFHVYQRVQARCASKCDAGPAFTSSKRPTYVVPPVPGATQRPPKPTKRNMWNHVRGIVAVTPRETPQFRAAAPTLHDLRWQLTQATSTADPD